MKFPMTIEIDGEDYIISKINYKDFLDIHYKRDYDWHKQEMRDDWKDEKENEGGVPPFAEWHETIHEYVLNFETWLAKEHTEEEIMKELREYVEEYQDEWGDD